MTPMNHGAHMSELIVEETFLEITSLAVANVRRAKHGFEPMTLKALKKDEAWDCFRVEQRVARQALEAAGYKIVRAE